MSPDLAPHPVSASDKVAAHHLDRLAVVYVRQSTLQQIEHHRESTQLQYGLADRACRLGWPRPKVMVIDEDLGLSAASTEGRTGFQRLVAEVGLGHVGLVLGFEVSRLARSCRDWYQLLEICALAGTLIADSDGVYDPAFYNDRLLLGLKGTMSEAELHIMRARSTRAVVTRRRAENSASRSRAAICAASPARSCSIPMSGCATRSSSFLTCSPVGAVCTAFCAILLPTASSCLTGCARDRPRAS